RVAVAVAPSKPQVVYANIESKKSALYRSDDGGKNWNRLDASRFLIWRPFYFGNLIVDPKDENKVFKPDLILLLSVNGGRSFSNVSGAIHGDLHDVWIFEDPSDRAYLYAEAQGGEIGRVNRYTHENRPIQPLPEYGEKKLRFNWNTPIHMSPNEKGTIYIGAEFLFGSRDHGQSWQ